MISFQVGLPELAAVAFAAELLALVPVAVVVTFLVVAFLAPAAFLFVSLTLPGEVAAESTGGLAAGEEATAATMMIMREGGSTRVRPEGRDTRIEINVLKKRTRRRSAPPYLNIPLPPSPNASRLPKSDHMTLLSHIFSGCVDFPVC